MLSFGVSGFLDKWYLFQCTDTIISWRDPERSTELALSFQETAGCSYVWLVKSLLLLSSSCHPSFIYITILLTENMVCNIQGSDLHYATKFAFQLSEQ